MSRFNPEHLHVSIASDRISLVRLQAYPGRRIRAEQTIEAHIDWRQPSTFASRLEQGMSGAPAKGLRVHVVLSDHLVKFFIFERVGGLRSLTELNDSIRARFEQIFGLSATEWEICADLRPFASHFLVCAVARDFLDAIKAAIAAHGSTAGSIQPFFVSELNRWRRRLGNAAGWFVIVERNGLSLAWIKRGEVTHLRTHRVEGDPLDALPDLLRLERLSNGVYLPEQRVWLAGMLASDSCPAADLEIAVQDQPLWPGRSEQWCRAYRLALSGVWP